jgi:type I restriction enzyme S subunit
MPSVANVSGTDLSKYKVIRKGQFAYSAMQVGRDETIRIALIHLMMNLLLFHQPIQ